MTRDEFKDNVSLLCRNAREQGLSASDVVLALNEVAAQASMPMPHDTTPITPPTSGGGGPTDDAA